MIWKYIGIGDKGFREGRDYLLVCWFWMWVWFFLNKNESSKVWVGGERVLFCVLLEGICGVLVCRVVDVVVL